VYKLNNIEALAVESETSKEPR